MASKLPARVLAAVAVLVAGRVFAQPAGLPRPVADHHGHLQSVAVWELFNERLPVVSLPRDLDQLLRDFERNWQLSDNKMALANQFTDSGMFQYADDWLRGRPAIRMMLLGQGGALRLRAQTFAIEEPSGHVAGAYGFYRDTVWVDQGRFLFVLHRDRGAPWRIAAASLTKTTPSPKPTRDPYSATDYVAELDSAGIRRGVVLSWAYQFATGFRAVADEESKVRQENDWTAREAARYPDRLVAFCSLNPLRAYAVDEVGRCASDPRIRGLKLHLTTAFFDFRDADHVRRLAAVFQAANARRLPIVIHLRAMNPEYGRRDAEIFLSQVLPRAPDVPIQIAHLAGMGWVRRGDQCGVVRVRGGVRVYRSSRVARVLQCLRSHRRFPGDGEPHGSAHTPNRSRPDALRRRSRRYAQSGLGDVDAASANSRRADPDRDQSRAVAPSLGYRPRRSGIAHPPPNGR